MLSFPDEGTRECYLGSGPARLLLLEAIGPGPYRSALERRGPGLHHAAFQFAGTLPESLLLLPGLRSTNGEPALLSDGRMLTIAELACLPLRQ